jgi:hypothetical protein
MNLEAMKFAKENNLPAEDYHSLMMEIIDEVADKHMMSLKDTDEG